VSSVVRPLAIVGLLLAATTMEPGAADIRPNVIVVLIDDMGWRDLSCQGSDFYETQRLA
jgi:arylsulfatase A-like enzyme